MYLDEGIYLSVLPYQYITPLNPTFFLVSSLKDIFIAFRERGTGRGREKETHQYERETLLVASCTHPNWGSNPQSRYVS